MQSATCLFVLENCCRQALFSKFSLAVLRGTCTGWPSARLSGPGRRWLCDVPGPGPVTQSSLTQDSNHAGRLVQGFAVFVQWVGICDDAATDGKLHPAIAECKGANQDAAVEISTGPAG